MTEPQIRSLEPESLLDVLAAHGVDFLVVGGFAVAAQGHPRATKDIDICPERSEANLSRLVAALDELEAEPIGLDEFKGEFDVARMKTAAGRDQDLVDVRTLKAQRRDLSS